MRRKRSAGGCDALDAAALWPSTAQLAGLPLPELVPKPSELER
jgi:hypothetical protein